MTLDSARKRAIREAMARERLSYSEAARRLAADRQAARGRDAAGGPSVCSCSPGRARSPAGGGWRAIERAEDPRTGDVAEIDFGLHFDSRADALSWARAWLRATRPGRRSGVIVRRLVQPCSPGCERVAAQS